MLNLKSMTHKSTNDLNNLQHLFFRIFLMSLTHEIPQKISTVPFSWMISLATSTHDFTTIILRLDFHVRFSTPSFFGAPINMSCEIGKNKGLFFYKILLFTKPRIVPTLAVSFSRKFRPRSELSNVSFSPCSRKCHGSF